MRPRSSGVSFRFGGGRVGIVAGLLLLAGGLLAAGAPVAGADVPDPDPPLTAQPLRLSLLDENDPLEHGLSPLCRDTVVAQGARGTVFSRSAWRRPLTGRLTLHTVARFGCPKSAGGAVGLTHVTRLSPALDLVLGAGVAHYPQLLRGGSLTKAVLRTDLVVQLPGGGSVSTGVQWIDLRPSKGVGPKRLGLSVSGQF
ncbi:MAG: hypothetical protein IT371_14675 [Deltaproteobacteria bacterium]|nr:hypothetical protein [Deltaproteobacteria bacterium]